MLVRTRNSVVECFVYIEEVVGSNPAASTNKQSLYQTMENNYNQSKNSYYFNMVIRQIQTFFISTPEAGFVAVILIGIVILVIIAKLFIHLPS